MNITATVNLEGMSRKFDLVAERVEDLDEPLREFGEHLKHRALERFNAQNFEPLKSGTLKQRARKGLKTAERKLERDVGRAFTRTRQKQQSKAPKGLLQAALTLMGAQPSGTSIAMRSRGIANRQAVLAEFQKQFRGGKGGMALSLKQMASLNDRVTRSVNKAMGKKILGKLPDSLVVEVGDGSVTLAERTEKEWSEVHNKGGTGGNRSKIPKRETVVLDDEDLGYFAILLKDYIVKPLVE